jgi:hypothetical protein
VLPAAPFVPLKIRLLPLTKVLLMTGRDCVATTLIAPAFNWFVFQASPAPGVAGVMFANELEIVPALRIWNVSTAASEDALTLTRLSVFQS